MTKIDDIIKLIQASKSDSSNDKRFGQHAIVYINLAWIILILAIILIIILSIDVAALNSDSLIKILSNFSTLLSIILSISSILFAYFTSRDTNNQYIAMGKALEEVRAASYQTIINNSDLISQVNAIAKDVSVLNSKYDLQSILGKNTSIQTMANNNMGLIENLPDNKVKDEK